MPLDSGVQYEHEKYKENERIKEEARRDALIFVEAVAETQSWPDDDRIMVEQMLGLIESDPPQNPRSGAAIRLR